MIRIGIFGYGNLAKGVELAVNAAGDMELVAIFTRRAPESVKTNTSNIVVKQKNAKVFEIFLIISSIILWNREKSISTSFT